MKIQDDEVNKCPEELPDGLIEYIRQVILPRDNVLIYKKGNIRGKCFICRQDVHARVGQRFRKYEAGSCPNCSSFVEFYNEGGSAYKNDYVCNLATIQKGEDGETVFIRLWHLCRDDTARWRLETILKNLEEICRYAIRGNQAAKWVHEAKENYFMSVYRYRLRDWTRAKDLSRVYDGDYWFYTPDNWKEIFNGTSLRYCDLDGYENYISCYPKNPIRFMEEWARYPALEKFWKAGYTKLVEERLVGYAEGHPIIWSQSSIQSAIKIPYRLLKQRKPSEWTHRDLWKISLLYRFVEQGRIKERELKQLIEFEYPLEYLEPVWGHATANKIIRYAKRFNPYLYRDYLKDCVTLRLDLDNEQVLFPEDLHAAHQRTIAMVKHEENKALRDKFEKVVSKLQRFAWEQGEYLIRPAVTQAELIVEGKALNHCVGGYADRMAKGETSIFLIRKKTEPKMPFYTLEWKNNKVVQCRTEHNKSYEHDEAVHSFVMAWIQWMNKKEKQNAA